MLEEETFTHDMGREIVRLLNENIKYSFVEIGERLADIADPDSRIHNPDFFLPVSRYPDEDLDSKAKRNLWVAETFAYFGIPDSARESAEDLGLVSVRYEIKENEKAELYNLLNAPNLTPHDIDSAFQVLLGYIRQNKAFSLPNGVQTDSPAFGRITADIGYVLRREGATNTRGWLPKINNDGSFRENFTTSYLRRLLGISSREILITAENIWKFLTSHFLLVNSTNRRGAWKLDHERLFVLKLSSRHICKRCGIVTAYSAKRCCPRKECDGSLEEQTFDPMMENIIARWVAGSDTKFKSLKSEEHTAQINKDLAKNIEDEFRAEGINLLSSTTTFEMGIDIGDLQKVLLRNAPPTSASYVQRVGRAGRGKDKNSVCVTLCRRTKYDADAWGDPPRLMTGEVKTPVVFIQNKFIKQRHFNAIVFARYLRSAVASTIQSLKQKIPLEIFLERRSLPEVPTSWFKFSTDLTTGFSEWINLQYDADIFHSQIGLHSLGSDFEACRNEAKKLYNLIFENIREELSALLVERKELFKIGSPQVDVDQSIRKLLDSDIIEVLAKRGFLPRYAFPLDVVTLETGFSRWSRDSDVELSRDRGIAIAEFAPSAQVIAHKKIFTSAGLYVVGKNDRPERRWYSKCPSCEQIRVEQIQDQLVGACPVCKRSISRQFIKPFIVPDSFSIRIDKNKQTVSRHRRSTLIRQRQTLTHFIDHVDEKFEDRNLFLVALKEEGKLFRYNLGPQNKGFILCPNCGFSEQESNYKRGNHKKLRVFSGSNKCGFMPWQRVAYGHTFSSFCLIVRPKSPPPSVESLAFALQKGLCLAMDMETSDIGVSWRWLDNKAAKRSEIILYDRAPGGSGFVKEGFENWEKVVQEAREICEKCTCEKACYDCLKNYSNQSYHDKLNREDMRNYLK